MIQRIQTKLKQRKVIVGSIFGILLLSLFLIIGFTDVVQLTITGLSVFRPEKSTSEENIDNSSAEDIPEDIVLLGTNETNETEDLPWWWGLDGNPSKPPVDEGPQFFGYKFFNLANGLSLWYNGVPFDLSATFFEGNLRFSIYKNSQPLSAFDIDVTGDINLASLVADTNESEGKALLYSDVSSLITTELFIPRKENHTQIRVCTNASSLEYVEEGCGTNENVSEYAISLLDEHLELVQEGSFFVLHNASNLGAVSELDSISPTISLVEPFHGSGNSNGSMELSFNAADASAVSSCSLYFDDDLVSTVTNVSNWQNETQSLSNVSEGSHNWNVECIDQYENTGFSDTFSVTVIPSSDFEGQSTDLSQVDIENITNFTLEILEDGMIQFTETINLSGGLNLDEIVEIDHNFISVDSSQAPQLNHSAVLTFYNIPEVQNPVIFVDGTVCEDCEIISFEDGSLEFSVPHFSNYTASENSELSLFDTTDSEIRYPNQQIYLFANYTNVTSSLPINGGGASCNITFSDTGTTGLTYNATSTLYEYNRTFSSPGVYLFDVLCDGTPLGYTALNSSDTVSISSVGGGPSGATVTALSSETAPAAAPGNDSAWSGNSTLVLFSGLTTTQSWQGYFGNVTGAIQLADASSNVLYNWSAVSPQGEVYASSAFDINFATVSCANQSHVQLAETSLNQTASDVDSISNTFNDSVHPSFFVADTQFLANSCNSTNLYGPTGAQSSSFYEVLLGDAALNLIYTSLLEEDVTGFDSNTHDFEMIVGEDGHGSDTATTPYYFFVELE